jgi:hypothetical protein
VCNRQPERNDDCKANDKSDYSRFSQGGVPSLISAYLRGRAFRVQALACLLGFHNRKLKLEL